MSGQNSEMERSYLQLVGADEAGLYVAASASTGIGVDVIVQAPADAAEVESAARLYAGDEKGVVSELAANEVRRALSTGGALLRLTATRQSTHEGWSWLPIHEAVREMRRKAGYDAY